MAHESSLWLLVHAEAQVSEVSILLACLALIFLGRTIEILCILGVTTLGTASLESA